MVGLGSSITMFLLGFVTVFLSFVDHAVNILDENDHPIFFAQDLDHDHPLAPHNHHHQYDPAHDHNDNADDENLNVRRVPPSPPP